MGNSPVLLKHGTCDACERQFCQSVACTTTGWKRKVALPQMMARARVRARVRAGQGRAGQGGRVQRTEALVTHQTVTPLGPSAMFVVLPLPCVVLVCRRLSKGSFVVFFRWS